MKEILLIQPPLLHQNLDVDAIQEAYWKVLKQKVYTILNEMPDGFQLHEYKNNITGFIEPNIGLFYVAGSLSDAGFSLKYLDFHILDSEIRTNENRTINETDIENVLNNYSCEIVMLSPLTANFHWAVKISEICKRLNDKSKSVIGGVHASFEYKNILMNHQWAVQQIELL